MIAATFTKQVDSYMPPEKENMKEIQRQRNESATPSSTCVTVTWLHKFGADGMVHNVNKKH
jgi:hypothetical protein